MSRAKTALAAVALLATGSVVQADDRAGNASVTADGIAVSDARIENPAAEGEDVAIAMTVSNDSGRLAKLVVVDSPAADRSTLHRTVGTGDAATMQPIPSIDIPGGGTAVELNSHGEHVMLIGLKRPLAAGDEVRLSASFFPGPTLDIRVPVEGTEETQERTGGERETSALDAPPGRD